MAKTLIRNFLIFFTPPARKKQRKCFAGVDGGLSEGSSVHRPRSEDPHLRQRKLIIFLTILITLNIPIFIQRSTLLLFQKVQTWKYILERKQLFQYIPSYSYKWRREARTHKRNPPLCLGLTANLIT